MSALFRSGSDGEDDPGPEGSDAAPPAAPADPADVQRLAERLLLGLGLEVTAEARDAGDTIEVNISGPDRDYLLSRKGEPLSAVRYLLNRIVYRGRQGKKIHIDSDGFRKLREDEIVEIAVRAAEKVREKGEEVVLSPLNSYERRLVHLALAEIEGVATKSLGDGFLKKVSIIPVKRGPGAGPDHA
jgi:spoIIIJ-associated protein